MAKGVYKYDNLTMSRIIELFGSGYSIVEIATLLGVHRNTVDRWIKRYNLKPLMVKSRTELAQGVIERALRSLSEGAKSEEIIEEYVKEVDTGKLDEDGKPIISTVKVTKKMKQLAPDAKALEIYSRKHEKDFAQKDVHNIEGITTNNILIANGINTSDMTLRDIQKHRIASANPLDVVETTSSEVDALSSVDEVDALSEASILDPPIRD